MRYHFSVCICTRNRPEELLRALRSIERSKHPVHEIIVSDDSTDDRTEKMVRSRFPEVRYIPGPRRGLSANRNHALRAVTGSHVLFMDDDVELGENFFSVVSETLRAGYERHGLKMIVTGLENLNGHIIYPHEQSFLGFQHRAYKSGEPLRTIVINSTVFPAFLFREIRFDELLIYGFDEVDLATRAAQRGYTIVLAERAVNFHYPSEINRDFYRPHLDKSRLYATFKRYGVTERKWLKAACFFILSFLHTVAHGAKKEGLKGILRSLQTFQGSVNLMMQGLRQS